MKRDAAVISIALTIVVIGCVSVAIAAVAHYLASRLAPWSEQ
jgi:hypothetical protein